MPPAFGNDLLGEANPPGLLRGLVVRTALPDDHAAGQGRAALRMDASLAGSVAGRARPLEDVGPFWDGTSVGKWDGNTLVVDTNNLDARGVDGSVEQPVQSVDQAAGRWAFRTSKDSLDLVMTIDDPVTYTSGGPPPKQLQVSNERHARRRND